MVVGFCFSVGFIGTLALLLEVGVPYLALPALSMVVSDFGHVVDKCVLVHPWIGRRGPSGDQIWLGITPAGGDGMGEMRVGIGGWLTTFCFVSLQLQDAVGIRRRPLAFFIPSQDQWQCYLHQSGLLAADF